MDEFGKECKLGILSRFGVSQKQKRKAWFIKVVSALNEYEESLKKRFIKVVIKDFSEAVSVKI